MGRVIILGSASAVPDAGHENTHILVESGSRIVLVDCPGSPTVRIEQAGVDPKLLTDIILTHFHPDHVSGFGPLMMGLWLTGRKEPLTVYGLQPTIDRAQKMMDLYDWKQWPNFYPVEFVCIAAEENSPVIDGPDLRVVASPVSHLIPTIGLRFEFGQSKHALTYSCDTEPSQAVRRLAEGADVLIHEATGSSVGHTSPEKAGEIATQAGVGALYLIHYPPQLVNPEDLLVQARKTYQGPIHVAHDLLEIKIGG
ncbi:MAG: MBL fold metallo-hydrolase [Chloroflexi bacterium]|nr:MAG: MBL fold metallo-hydrolase [Chloroflexota bacterium]